MFSKNLKGSTMPRHQILTWTNIPSGQTQICRNYAQNTVGEIPVLTTSHGCECVSTHILRKTFNLMAGLDFVHTYLDDLLMISDSTFEDCFYQLQVVLQRISRAGLKVNAEKSSIFANQIKNLGQMFTIYDIQSVQKKIQDILDLHIRSRGDQSGYFILGIHLEGTGLLEDFGCFKMLLELFSITKLFLFFLILL